MTLELQNISRGIRLSFFCLLFSIIAMCAFTILIANNLGKASLSKAVKQSYELNQAGREQMKLEILKELKSIKQAVTGVPSSDNNRQVMR